MVSLGLANASAQQLLKAPVNPDFLKFKDKKITIQTVPAASPKHALGYIPSPVDLSHLSMPVVEKRDGRYTPDGYAASYDLRSEINKLSPEKTKGIVALAGLSRLTAPWNPFLCL